MQNLHHAPFLFGAAKFIAKGKRDVLITSFNYPDETSVATLRLGDNNRMGKNASFSF